MDHALQKKCHVPGNRSEFSDTDLVDRIHRDAFAYFPDMTNPRNGLVRDCTRPGSPASIAAVGFALAALAVGVERGFVTRVEAASRARTTLRFFWASHQGPEGDATGYKGFYYHFLDAETGRRTWQSELSTVDTALLLAGALTAAAYFDEHNSVEAEVRELAEALYRRVDWCWAQNGEATLTHGWTPEDGFLPYRWSGYDESTILYLLALGSPAHSTGPESYEAYTSSYNFKVANGLEYLYAGPLFIHQYSHLWVDFQGIRDRTMRARGFDYFENSRRATLVHQDYAIRNPLQFNHVCDCCWGLTASDGPGPCTRRLDGIERTFHGYMARGAPFGPDDGTIAPWAAVASLPFAPEIVIPTIRRMVRLHVGPDHCSYGLAASFNPIFPAEGGRGWVSPWNFALNQGPIVLMIENWRSGLLWKLMRRCPFLVEGLRRADFTGGWLGPKA